MKTEIAIRLTGTMMAGLFLGLSLPGIAMAHPGGMSPAVHPQVHPVVHPHAGGAANLGMTHMSPTAATFGQNVASVASSQGSKISKDAQSGMTGQKLSGVAREHGDSVSDVATGQENPGQVSSPPVSPVP